MKRTHNRKPFAGRPAGGPKSRWGNGVGNGLKKMKFVKWAEQVQDRSDQQMHTIQHNTTQHNTTQFMIIITPTHFDTGVPFAGSVRTHI